MTLTHALRNIRYAIDGGDGGGGGGGSSSGTSGATSGGSGSSGSSSGGSSSGSAGAAPSRSSAAGSGTSSGNGAPPRDNSPKVSPFVALAAKAGVQPKHGGVNKLPDVLANREMVVDPGDADVIDKPKVTIPKSKPGIGEVEFNNDSLDTEEQQEEKAKESAPEGEVEQTEQDAEINTQDNDESSQTQQIQTQNKNYVNLEDVEPEDKSFLSKMHTSAAKHFVTKIKSLRNELAAKTAQLKKVEDGGLPLDYYNHSEAFRLHPEYGKIQSNVDFANRELNFWREQLISIESGKDFYLFDGVDDQGNDILRGPFKPSPRAKVAIQDAQMRVNQALSSEQVKLQQLQSGFKKEYDGAAGVIKNALQQKMGWLLQGDVDKTMLTSAGPDGKPVQRSLGDLTKEFVSHIPAVYQQHPVTEALVTVFKAFQVLGSKYVTQAAQLRKQNITDKTVQLAEPRGEASAVAKNKNNRVVNIGGRKVVDRDFKYNALDM